MTDAIAALRAFNRFYTGQVGALDAQFLGSNLSLVEARVLYEIAMRESAAASGIAADLGLDAGFLSRIVRRLLAAGLIARGRDGDARRRPLALTENGRDAFARLDARQHAHVAEHLAHLDPAGGAALVDALAQVRALLAPAPAPIELREFRHGDMGPIVVAQTRYYSTHHGWRNGMETMLLDITATFLRTHVAGRSNCWIAERDGAAVGSVFCFDAGGGTAQLRLMYADPSVRGQGVGRRLVEACVGFARAGGYREIILWTHSVLLPARALYARAGFELTSTELHEEFGEPVQGETWTLKLDRM